MMTNGFTNAERAKQFTTCKRCGATHPRGTVCVLCADAKPKRPKRVEKKTREPKYPPWYTTDAMIRSGLRRMSLRCREKSEALKRAGYSCCKCGVKRSVARGHEEQVECHHCNPVAEHDGMNIIIAAIRKYLIVPPEEWEPLCPRCHAEEHAKEVMND